MKKIWALLGQTTFFITKPLISVYLKSSHRTRIILISEGHILLAKDWLGNGKYSLPGGGIKKREDSSLAAARELKEETGIAIRSSQLKLLKDKLWVNPSGFSFYIDVYLVELSGMPTPMRRGLEILDVEWLPISQMSSDKRISDEAKQLVVAWLKGLSFDRLQI